MNLFKHTTTALLSLASILGAHAADFNVTVSGGPSSFYSFNGAGQNPTLTVVRGETYTFAVNTGSFHPFRINSTGVTPPIFLGTMTWTVPLAAANYSYECTIHRFGGSIVTVPPPTVRIVDLAVGSELRVRSTGASNYSVRPEFKNNVTSPNWFALDVRTNRFLTGTNETICGVPTGSNVFIRVRAQRN